MKSTVSNQPDRSTAQPDTKQSSRNRRTATVKDRRLADKKQIAHQHINLQLAALGQPTVQQAHNNAYLDIADSLLKNYQQHRHLLADYRCPADYRIETFLRDYLKENGVDIHVQLPDTSFLLSRAGLARELSLPIGKPFYRSSLLSSYRVMQGVLHNPKNDRRTTTGVFHIVEGGLPVPGDKYAVPVPAYARLLQAALNPPDDIMVLPITSEQYQPATCWVSLLVRPVVRPEVKGALTARTMETRVFAPGGLTANLDFIESIFGNAGDPFLPENDAALDIEHWTGHSGCIILAPHLVRLRKKDLGLPHYIDASERQRKEGMCWKDESERYNDGNAFKVVCRDMRGVIVTIIADNYFGYSKKEIKSQISYSANLFGGCEEEHAGGAIAFPCFNLGETYYHDVNYDLRHYTFKRLRNQLAPWISVKAEGYAVDRMFNDICYIPENAQMNLQEKRVYWEKEDGETVRIKLLAGYTYVYPSGFKVHMEKHPGGASWRLIGTLGEGTFCHKPSTVSGGGKSEISKSIAGSIISGPVFVDDFDENLDQVEAIFNRDYSSRFRDPQRVDKRALLSPFRTLGSVIRLLTPSAEEYNDEYNAWLESIPQHIMALVFMIKRFYDPEWGSDWRQHFSVDEINGHPGHELKCNGRKLIASYLRVGMNNDGTWRVYKLRQDFVASEKVQMEDDITASTVVPTNYVEGLNGAHSSHPGVKIVENCEARLFQRPDDAIVRGYDVQAESDLSEENNFISNFEPLNSQDANDIIDDVIEFDKYSRPMKKLIKRAARQHDRYFVSSSHPRIVGGIPSPNVRYLQRRPDLANPRAYHLAVTGTRLARGIYYDQSVYFPVNAVLQGRRNNPADCASGIRPLAVYNPIHYQELPELFMDLICSLTGKSPSTTGAGSEGALTKGPFNALAASADLNNALVSFILCGFDGFSSAAGYIGALRRVDHDISMLIPEIWSRIPVGKRRPDYLISQGLLEKLEDFDYKGRRVLASRLGYRITKKFTHRFLGKIFDNPMIVFDEAMLKPETQDMEAFVDGIHNITEAHQRVAQTYIDDDTIKDVCPPLQALLHIMVSGEYDGMTIDDPRIRTMFTREYLLQSEWYAERLRIKQERDRDLWLKNHAYLEKMLDKLHESEDELRADLYQRIEKAECMIETVAGSEYLDRLKFTLGADWIHHEDMVDSQFE